MKRAVLLLAAAAGGACATPNLVLETGPGGELGAGLFAPQRAEAVAIPAADGAVLRGVWIPGEPGAPVVLQLMEATVGATEARRIHGLYWDLPGAGYATLAVDYRGVAASGGPRSSNHLRADARAMWREAVARAGGDPARVVLRGGSAGALAAATLLQDGARPGAVVLYGPVRSETVVRHFMTTGWAGTPRVPEPLAPWLALLFRRPLAVDLEQVLARCASPLLLILGEADELLPPEEAGRLTEAARAAGGEVIREPLGHVELCTRHHRLREGERGFLAARMPVAVDLAAREQAALDALAAAGALAPERERLRQLVAQRIEDPPAALGGLLAAGFAAERAAAWLDADRAVRGRWLAGRSAAEIRALAEAAAPGDPDDEVLFQLVAQVWGPAAAQGLRLESCAFIGDASTIRLRSDYVRTAGGASAKTRAEFDARAWLAAASRGAGTSDARARLDRWLALVAPAG